MGPMTLLDLVIALIVMGVALYVINRFIPMDGNVKGILNVVVILAILLWVLGMFMGPSSFWSQRVGR